ncbi:G2/M phase-specific E3 ubiquitin-protein ligase [Sarotherodon galilaeus]
MAASSSGGPSKPQELEARVITAAQDIINRLAQSLQQTNTTCIPNAEHSHEDSGGQAQTPKDRVQTEMARSFPGFFTKKRGKNRFSPLQSSALRPKSSKPFSVYIYLVNKGCTNTPSATEELQLSQAGLGKRSLILTDDMSHTMINKMIMEEYPKMDGVQGWLLHKSSGGQGRRKLVAIPPDVNGYTGRLIRNVSSAGKTLLYVVPLQQDLDLTPLPSDAAEFQTIPKASCQVCKESMPLHILALHVNNCVKSHDTPAVKPAECPICLCCFPVNEIAQHASLCGMIYILCPFRLSADVLQWLSSQVDTSIDFRICITRNDLVQRGFIQWQRQKKGSPVNKLHVTFIGEAGIDTGALSKEFLTEMMHGIETRLFEGSGKKGKSPVYSISDLENSFYRTAGEVFSVSLAQGGPPPCFLRSWCYQFLATGNFDALKLTKDDVDDTEYRSLIEKVEVADNLTDLTEDIVSCGYTGLVKLYKRDSIIRSIVVHATVRLTPMLQQIRTAMKIYNLLEVIGRHESLCSNLFVPRDENDDTAPDADYLMSILEPELSERGSPRHAKENAIINFFQDFLENLEKHWSSKHQPPRMSVPAIMQWLTGQRHKPCLPSERANFKIHVRFEHQCKDTMPEHYICYPLVSACTNTIFFPVAHMNSYTEFTEVMTTAVTMGRDFSRV